MQRNALQQLLAWKNSANRKPLVIQGARQVGKTWLMKTFAKQHYAKMAYISFADMPDAANIFQGNYHLEQILLGISIFTQTTITAEDTLIIFDEIQECERALNVLKFFNENAPQYHIIAAGSLLGVAVRKKQYSFPVGQVDFLNLYPLNFNEFLLALGENQLADLMQKQDWNMIKIFHEKYIDLLKQYLFIGGMPEAVKTFLNTQNLDEVRKIQNAILIGYKEDFSKYTEHKNIAKIMSVWQSMPAQLAKENKKFTYKNIQQGARAREYEDAIEWLLLTGLVYKINRISKPDLPLLAYQDNTAFKLYLLDTGLLSALSLLNAKTIIDGNDIFTEFKGALTEQFVLQELKSNYHFPIAYWGAENGTAEIDFIIQNQQNIIPIEVKSSINLKAKSLMSYRQKYNPHIAIRTSLARFEINQTLYNVPLYGIGAYFQTFQAA